MQHNLFTHSSADGHLGCFHVLVIVNTRNPGNMCLFVSLSCSPCSHVLCCFDGFLRVYDLTTVGLLGHMVVLFLAFLRNLHCCSLGVPSGTTGKVPSCPCRRHRGAGSVPGLGRSPGGGHATHCSTLTWRIPWTEELGRLQSIGSQRVRHG